MWRLRMSSAPENRVEKESEENAVDRERVKILQLVRSPLAFLTLAALICEAVFGGIGALQQKEQVMIFAMHMFLGIVGAVVLVAVWCPRSLYRPNEIKGVEDEVFGTDTKAKWVVTGSLGLALIVYIAYRLIKDFLLVETCFRNTGIGYL
jgi:hypothetical protein